MKLEDLPVALQRKIVAWQKCRPIPGVALDFARLDDFGNEVRWTDYAKQTAYGWEIDHRHPSGLGGSDGLHNLRALHWRKNRELGALVSAIKGFVGQPSMTNPANIYSQIAQALEPGAMTRPRGLFGSSYRNPYR